MLKSISISDIKVGKRYRKNLGDIQEMADSINENGLLHPIGVNKNNELKFGLIRLEAVKILGWKEIRAIETECSDAEFVENCSRKDLELEEKVALAEDIIKKYKGQGKRKDLEHINAGSQVPKGMKTDDYVAKLVGYASRASLKMAIAIVKSKDKALIKEIDAGNLSLTKASEINKMNKTDKEKVMNFLSDKKRYGRKACKILNEVNALDRQKRNQDLINQHGTDKTEDKLYKIYDTSCEDFIKKYDAGSVDVVVSDPPYDKPNLEAYDLLGKVAAHALKENGLCICSANHCFTGDHIKRMEAFGFKQLWEIATVFTGVYGTHEVQHKNVMNGWRPWIVFVKGNATRFKKLFPDVIKVDDINHYEEAKGFFEWQQSVPMMEKLIKYFSEEGDIVLDPFMGSASTGVAAINSNRQFIGYEIEKMRFELSKIRLKYKGKIFYNEKTKKFEPLPEAKEEEK